MSLLLLEVHLETLKPYPPHRWFLRTLVNGQPLSPALDTAYWEASL